jgi:hypothetical protein
VSKFARRAVVVTSCATLLCAGLAALIYQARPASTQHSALLADQQHRPVNPKALQRGRPLPPLRHGEIRVTAVGADMMPPTVLQAAATRVSPASARAIAHAKAPLPGLATGTATTRLMMYTNVYGPIRRNGTMSPSVPLALSWIVTFNNAAPFVSRPVNFKGTMPSLTCQYVAVISAIDGHQLDAYQVCQAKH